MVSFSGTAFISSFSRALASCCRVSSSTACTAVTKTNLSWKPSCCHLQTAMRACLQAAKVASSRLHSIQIGLPKDLYICSPASCCCCVSIALPCDSLKATLRSSTCQGAAIHSESHAGRPAPSSHFCMSHIRFVATSPSAQPLCPPAFLPYAHAGNTRLAGSSDAFGRWQLAQPTCRAALPLR